MVLKLILYSYILDVKMTICTNTKNVFVHM